MALERQNITINLGVGLNTKVDPKLMTDGLLGLENGVFTSVGQVQKRYGLSSLGSKTTAGDTISSAKSISVFQDELNLIDSSKFYSYIASTDTWIDKGIISGVSAKTVGVLRDSYTQSSPDIAYLNGTTVYVYQDSAGGIRATVIDEVSGNQVQSNVQLSTTGVNPKCAVTVNNILVYYVETNTLKCSALAVANNSAFVAAITVVSNIHATAIYDISRAGNNNLLAYRKSTGSKIVTSYLTASGSVAGATEGYPAAVEFSADPDGSICILSYYEGDITNDAIYVIYHNSVAGTKAIIYNIELSNSPSAITIDASTVVSRNITAISTSATAIQIWYEVTHASSYYHYIKSNTLSRSGTAGTAAVWARGVGLVSKAFEGYDGNVYLIVAHESTLQSTNFVLKSVSTSSHFCVNRISYQVSGGLTANVSGLCNVYNSDTYDYVSAMVVKTKLNSENDNVFTTNGIQKIVLNFDTTELFDTAQLGNNLHIAAGMLFDYDGTNLVEHGFNLYPENMVTANSTAAAGMTNGTRQYVVVYEWADIQGQIHRSAPSIAFSSVTALTTNVTTITIPTLRITEKKTTKGDVSIAVYRTENNGTVFYRVSSITSPLLNISSQDTLAFTDNKTDASILANELLYTTGGILENIVPPSCTKVYVYNNRLVLAGLEDSNQIWYSRQFAQSESVNFSDFITTRLDQGKKGVTGIVQLDEKIVFFKDNAIYYQVANGPTDTGFNNDIYTPQAIATDVGCTSSKSIVTTPLGVMFKSKKGYYLLDRSLQVQYIGAQVEAYNELTPSGSLLCDSVNQVRFTHTDGPCLVYDYYIKQWSTFTNHNSVATRRWNSNFVILRSNGIVDSEDTTSYLDNSSNIQMKVVTNWIQVGGLQGFQRVYQASLIGKFRSNHILRVRIGYNFEESYRDDFNINSITALGSSIYGDDTTYGAGLYYGGVTDSQFQFKINNSIQKCQAIRYEITTVNPESIDGASFNLTAISLDVGIKKGLFKIAKLKNM